MDADILNVTQRPVWDTSISNAEKHTHQPYANTTFKNNDVIRIPIENEDVYTFPWDSLIYIEGKVLKPDGTAPSTTAKFVNNGIMFLFDEIRYEIGGKTIDSVRNPGITTTMKGYLSYNKNESLRLQNAGWSPLETNDLIDSNGYFNVCIPLRMVLGFAEDFRKILLNVKQELILIRSSSDVNAFILPEADTTNLTVELTQVSWKIPHIAVSDAERLKLLKLLQKNVSMDMAFRRWELHEFPLLQQTQYHTWAVKTTSQVEKPRFIILAFQTDRNHNLHRNKSQFDHCNLSNVKLHLGSSLYPYDNLHLDFDKNKFSILYEMYAQFQHSYYGSTSEPVFSPADFKSKAPLVVIDCSRQNETVKTGAVDVRLEFETNKNIPGNTSAYCLILHDRVIRYNPSTNIVHEV